MCQAHIGCPYPGGKQWQMATYLICHADIGKSLVNKYVEDMPLLCVGNTTASKSKGQDVDINQRSNAAAGSFLIFSRSCLGAMTPWKYRMIAAAYLSSLGSFSNMRWATRLALPATVLQHSRPVPGLSDVYIQNPHSTQRPCIWLA